MHGTDSNPGNVRWLIGGAFGVGLIVLAVMFGGSGRHDPSNGQSPASSAGDSGGGISY